MKIGIITCHDVYNCGSSLQAYALSQIVNDNCEAEIIDYRPHYLFKLIDFMEVDSEKWKKNIIRRWIYRIYMAPTKVRRLKTYKMFKDFNRRYLPLSKKKYYSLVDLLSAEKYDKCICGSDQIWNSGQYHCGEDPAFYLSFTNADKIAYAASFGGTVISAIGEENIKSYLPLFSAISVREDSGVRILKKYGFHSEQVLDPVFLLSSDTWRKISHKPRNVPEKYVLVYGYDNSDEYVELLQEYSEYTLLYFNSKTLRDAGPLEFIWLIDHAETVITTSFHAVAFSIILHTQFITAMTAKTDLYNRLEAILALCGLSYRRYDILKEFDDWQQKRIDFRTVDSVLATWKMKSENFLLSAIGEYSDK